MLRYKLQSAVEFRHLQGATSVFCMFEPLHRGPLSTCVPSQPNVFAPLWNHPSINTVPLTPPLFASPVQIQLKDSKHACIEIPFHPDILYIVWNKARRECDRTNEYTYCGRDKNCWVGGGGRGNFVQTHETRPQHQGSKTFLQLIFHSQDHSRNEVFRAKNEFEKALSFLRSESNYISEWGLIWSNF
jgi:hypothetical protein